MLQLSNTLLRLAANIALLIYFALVLIILAGRYLVLPNIDQWRGAIAQQLSAALDVEVELGEVRAHWKGLNPSFNLENVTISEPRRGSVLQVPAVHGTLSWRSVFSFEPKFLSLSANGVDLTLRRDKHERLHVLGRSFDPEAAPSQPGEGRDNFLAWLLAQRNIRLQDSTIRWLDEYKAAPPLVLHDLTFIAQNQGSNHLFSLTAQAQDEVGGTLDIRGRFATDLKARLTAAELSGARGELYFSVDQVQPAKWSAWLDLPPEVKTGRLSSKNWLQFSNGQIERITSDIRVEGGNWTADETVEIRTRGSRLYLDGSWNAYRNMTRDDGIASQNTASMDYRFSARGVSVVAPGLFERPIEVAELDVDGAVHRDNGGAWHVQADALSILNDDIKAVLQGNWRTDGSGGAGMVDIQGDIAWARVDAIHNYMPLMVDDEARDWMAKGLINGRIENAHLTLNGELRHFPFGEHPDKGDFHVAGRFRDAAIDYLPAEGKERGWPNLENMDGHISLHRVDLNIQADRASMRPLPETPITLTAVKARIANVEQDPRLEIQGQTAAEAKAYLNLAKHSPLGEMLGGLLDETEASGRWEVPLALSIPLAESLNTSVKGEVRFSGGDLQLIPVMPPFTGLTGALHFTESDISASSVKAQLLGGPVTVGGSVGGRGKGLVFEGKTSAAALAKTIDLPGMKRLTGATSYQATLQRGGTGTLSFGLSSNLHGMGLDFPAPLAKPAEISLPLNVRWKPQGKVGDMALQLSLGKEMEAVFLHSHKPAKPSYFHAGYISVHQKAQMPAEGLAVDLRYPTVDLDAWHQVLNEFEPSKGAPKSNDVQATLMPALAQFRLQAKEAKVRGLTLDELTFTARRPASQQWRVDISSSQTAGTLFWTEAQGKIAGRVDAHFDRVALGVQDEVQDADPQADDTFKFDDELDIPAVNLRIKDLSLYGYHVGSLSLVGVNQSRGSPWRLDELKLASPHAVLDGSGIWRLSGAERGLELDAVVSVSDLGGYMDQLGLKDAMKAGQGTITGKLQWHNMPWDFNKADLNGDIEFKLEKGRFGSVNSYSARLLELLSMQSLRRLARLELNPGGLTKDGFPYDDLRGTVQMRKGVLSTRDYRVIGPVGTIVMDGTVDLNDERMNLQAVVVPNLDVSGAAIAAGIAVNPIVGVGAFLTQWLLRAPLAKAMTVQYQVTGSWKDPKIQEVGGVHSDESATSNGKRKHQHDEVIAH